MTEEEYVEFLADFSVALDADLDKLDEILHIGRRAAISDKDWPRASVAYQLALTMITEIAAELKRQSARSITLEVYNHEDFDVDDMVDGTGHYL